MHFVTGRVIHYRKVSKKLVFLDVRTNLPHELARHAELVVLKVRAS
jgi:hypothetical protein